MHWAKISVEQFSKSKFLRFVAVGCTNYIISGSVFWLCLSILTESPLKATISQLISYTAGIFWSFYWNRRVTFRNTTGSVMHQAGLFVALQVSLAVISAALIGLSIDILDFPPGPSWFLIMCLITAINFLLCKRWVMK